MYPEKDKYRLLVENLPDGLVYCKMVQDNTGKPVDYIFLEVNPFFEALTGLPRDHIIGKKVTELYPGIKGIGFDWIGVSDQVAATGKSIRFQQYFDLSERWYDITAYSDQLGYFTAVFHDITERKQAEEALWKSERRFRDVTENALEWVWEVDASGKYIYASPVCEKILGYKPEELLGKHFYDLFAPEGREQLKKTAFEAFANKQPFRELINCNICKSGKPVWISTSGVPILDEKDNLLGYRGTDMDITQRLQTEEELKLSYQKLQKTLKSTIQAIALILEKRDPYTAGHQKRMTKLACAIAEEMSLPQDKIEVLYIAGIIHDIGKINVPTEILSKPGRLSEIELSLIKTHPAVADVVEAMASHRPYRPALGIDKALEEITQNRGILYDPEVVDTCLKLFKEKGFKLE